MAAFGHRTIERRRAQEDAYRSIEATLAAEQRALQVAHWEHTTAARSELQARQDRAKQLEQERAKDLLRRKQALSALLNEERVRWRAEVMERVETLDDRKARIRERALALRDAREKERQRQVQERLDQQWRDACDDARLLDSQALARFMSQERHAQIQDKMRRNEELSRNENAFMAEWNRQLEVMHQQDLAKKARQHQADVDTAAALKEQMAWRARQRDDEYHATMRDAAQELAECREAMRQDAEKQKKRHDDEVARGREIQEYNKQFKIISAEEARVQAEQDAILLNYALQKEREQLAAEKAKRESGRQAALMYKKYLEEQMVKEAEDNSWIDEVRKREEERVWKARDDALQAREDARAYLMKVVDEGRQEQLRATRAATAAEAAEGQIFADKFIREAQEGIEQERVEAEARRRLAQQNNAKLFEQMALRKRQDDLTRQEIFLADKHMQYIEKKHRQRLAEQGGAIRTRFPLKQNNWFS